MSLKSDRRKARHHDSGDRSPNNTLRIEHGSLKRGVSIVASLQSILVFVEQLIKGYGPPARFTSLCTDMIQTYDKKEEKVVRKFIGDEICLGGKRPLIVTSTSGNQNYDDLRLEFINQFPGGDRLIHKPVNRIIRRRERRKNPYVSKDLDDILDMIWEATEEFERVHKMSVFIQTIVILHLSTCENYYAYASELIQLIKSRTNIEWDANKDCLRNQIKKLPDLVYGDRGRYELLHPIKGSDEPDFFECEYEKLCKDFQGVKGVPEWQE